MISDTEKIDSGNWWCVVDFDTTINPPTITIRKGEKGSVDGKNFVIRSHKLENEVAGKVWEKFNDIQLNKLPETLNELISLSEQP